MCGIGGISTSYGFTYDECQEGLRLFKSLTRRGTDAFGFFDGKSYYKEPGSFLESDKRCDLVEELYHAKTNLFLCHTRQATKGDPKHNPNNHPFFVDPFVMAHNGYFWYTDPINQPLAKPQQDIETDSYQLLLWLVQEYRQLAIPNVSVAIANAMKHVSGYYAIWLFDANDGWTYLFRGDNKTMSTVCYMTKNRLGRKVIFGSDVGSLLDTLKITDDNWKKNQKPVIYRTNPFKIFRFRNGVIERAGEFKERETGVVGGLYDWYIGGRYGGDYGGGAGWATDDWKISRKRLKKLRRWWRRKHPGEEPPEDFNSFLEGEMFQRFHTDDLTPQEVI